MGFCDVQWKVAETTVCCSLDLWLSLVFGAELLSTFLAGAAQIELPSDLRAVQLTHVDGPIAVVRVAPPVASVHLADQDFGTICAEVVSRIWTQHLPRILCFFGAIHNRRSCNECRSQDRFVAYSTEFFGHVVRDTEGT